MFLAALGGSIAMKQADRRPELHIGDILDGSQWDEGGDGWRHDCSS